MPLIYKSRKVIEQTYRRYALWRCRRIPRYATSRLFVSPFRADLRITFADLRVRRCHSMRPTHRPRHFRSLQSLERFIRYLVALSEIRLSSQHRSIRVGLASVCRRRRMSTRPTHGTRVYLDSVIILRASHPYSGHVVLRFLFLLKRDSDVCYVSDTRRELAL